MKISHESEIAECYHDLTKISIFFELSNTALYCRQSKMCEVLRICIVGTIFRVVMRQQPSEIFMMCPCGKSISYKECCGRYIDCNLLPLTSEALMRSRYTAFFFGKVNYLASTMKGNALKNFNFDRLEQWLSRVKWQGLTVVKTKMKSDSLGYVTFKAYYIENDVNKIIYEKSKFKKIGGKWFYVDGKRIQA